MQLLKSFSHEKKQKYFKVDGSHSSQNGLNQDSSEAFGTSSILNLFDSTDEDDLSKTFFAMSSNPANCHQVSLFHLNLLKSQEIH